MTFASFGTVEWFAFVFILIVALKLLVVIFNPKAWNSGVIKKVWANSALTTIIALILSGVVLFYLLESGITMVQIFAVMVFLMLFMAIGIMAYKKEFLSLTEKLLKDRSIVKRSSLYILLWVILLLWGLKELFM
jgi:hypothetical protein